MGYALVLTTVYAAQSHVFFDGYAWPQRLLAIGLFVDGACTLAFTGTMTKRQVVSIMTGIGTIDRMKLEKGKEIAGALRMISSMSLAMAPIFCGRSRPRRTLARA